MGNYPVTFNVTYPEKSNKLTVFFRLFLAIPILIILVLLTYSSYDSNQSAQGVERFYSAGIVVLPTLLMIVFRRKYPKWWFDWNLALIKFSLRVISYLLLLRDEYPSTDDEQSVQVQLPYPDAGKELNQWLPLVKWLLAIPHVIILCILLIGVILCSILAWFIILFTGRYPKAMFDFVVGFLRWALRVEAYALLLTTDIYPPFMLAE